MTKAVQGVVHGKFIQLREEPGFAEGQEVQLFVTPIASGKQWGEGLRPCAGALVTEWMEADDRILEEIHEERRLDSRRVA
jgi:hypothetical protein